MPRTFIDGFQNALIQTSSDGSGFQVVVPLKVTRYAWHFKVVGLARLVFQKFEKQKFSSGFWQTVQSNRTFLPQMVRLAANGFIVQAIEIANEVGPQSGHPRTLAA